MLNNNKAVATIAVKDIEAARKFYGQTLGLKELNRMGDEFVEYESGDSSINVYHSDFAGTNKATSMTWSVGNEVDNVVRELKSKNIQFEHYDLPDTKLEGDIHVGHGVRVAWFKDPDGNILSLAGR